MTVKRRLFWSNILMILVPVGATALVGSLCVGMVWLALVHGIGLGLNDPEDFDRACIVLTELVEQNLQIGGDLSSLEAVLDSSGLAMTVYCDDQPYFAYGEAEEKDAALMAAAELLGDGASLTQGGRSLYVYSETIYGQMYQIWLFGGGTIVQRYGGVKTVLAIAIIIILITIFLSIALTNRFLTKFVFMRISEPLDILTSGVHEIRDGNLDYRIVYDREDEFQPVCADFNEMAARLKESVDQLQRQERSRKELVAGISHDIRSPLTSIQAYVEGLLDGVAKTPEARERYLQTIKTKAEDLEHMVSQLFLFSKMELGEYPENRRPLQLDQTIRQTVAALEEACERQGLQIRLSLTPVCANADPVQIQRIVTNCIENSCKYKDQPRGTLEISLQRTAHGVCLSFADDGPGVPKEALPHLFEVFYRSDPARQNPDKGSGLGLAIVANAVHAMGGTVQALPRVPRGLEIRMEFPEEGEEDGENSDRRR